MFTFALMYKQHFWKTCSSCHCSCQGELECQVSVGRRRVSYVSIYIFNIWIIDHECNDIFDIKLSNESSNREVEEVLEWALVFSHEIEVIVACESTGKVHGQWDSWGDSVARVRDRREEKGLTNHKWRNPKLWGASCCSWRLSFMRDKSHKVKRFLTAAQV